MSKLEFDRDISASTRFAEGFYNGIKWAICHAFTFGIYHSKYLELENKTSFRKEYLRHMAKATVFFPLLLCSTYGMR